MHPQDDESSRHDYTEATDSTIDVSVLPKVMQVENFGRRGKYAFLRKLRYVTA